VPEPAIVAPPECGFLRTSHAMPTMTASAAATSGQLAVHRGRTGPVIGGAAGACGAAVSPVWGGFALEGVDDVIESTQTL